MSTVDPQSRLYRRHWFLPTLRVTLWTLSGVTAFAIAFVLAVLPFDDGAWALGLVAIPLLLVVAIGITDANTEIPARQAHYPWPYLLWMIGLWAVCAGAALASGGLWWPVSTPDTSWLKPTIGGGALLVGAGLLVSSALLRKNRHNLAQRAQSIRLTSPRVPAVVTEVTRNRGDNTMPLWNITLRFQDSQGTDRWHKRVHHRKLPVGGRHWIRYDPAKPGRRSTLFVEWQSR